MVKPNLTNLGLNLTHIVSNLTTQFAKAFCELVAKFGKFQVASRKAQGSLKCQI
ncbi:hypothetical protein CSUNSWCD_878 [Campylobacter showae CSUNSWCD]|uniref:Uncharacterized protein n=1 Tax=Campylobacter showae CSUNSWCD TaxID=1244083 RepID=M5IDW5_9BACT|nr:hypothetical protein CSUNSWCD_878 [Campylobacter showae CSUNSWCD]